MKSINKHIANYWILYVFASLVIIIDFYIIKGSWTSLLMFLGFFLLLGWIDKRRRKRNKNIIKRNLLTEEEFKYNNPVKDIEDKENYNTSDTFFVIIYIIILYLKFS